MATLLPIFLLLSVVGAGAQPAAPAPDSGCNSILLTYTLSGRTKLRPFVAEAAAQPYSFQAAASVANAGAATLKSWTLLVNYTHGEILVSVGGAVLADAGDLPYNTSLDGGNATAFAGYPNADLLTPIATAGDRSLTEADISIVGTLFAAPDPPVPLPASISLGNPEYVCPTPSLVFNSTNAISTCCVLNPRFANSSSTNLSDAADNYLPRRSGDLVISYDVVDAYSSNYVALVKIDNRAKLGRLDNWHLQWEWERGEFVYAMKGAYPLEVDPSGCVLGKPAQYYQGLDLSKALNCQRRPVILDLPISMYNNSDMGLIPHCCRNGSLLPAAMDLDKAMSAFYITVYKMPPDLNVTKIYPPANFKIWGASPLNPDYTCGTAIRVSPTEFPNPSGLQSSSFALASWQVVCNITVKNQKPKCCVTFSAYYNQSVIPCNTCACGCPAQAIGGSKCSTTAPSLLLPPEALLVPFANRTSQAVAWAGINHLQVNNPLPCGDFCGVSINWHIATDYTNGWSARITLFNWDDVDMPDWFAAVVMDKAYDGFQQAYSFNATSIGNNTIFMQGNLGLNYLVKEDNGTSAAPPNPGKQQSVISFTKGPTPGIKVVAGDGFPSKLYFNGDECAMPDRLLVSTGVRKVACGILVMVLAATASTVLPFAL